MAAADVAAPRPVPAIRAASALRISLQRGVRRGWVPGARELGRWARAALGARGAGCEIAVYVVGAARSRTLNGRYRQRHHATNVLSFPAASVPVRPRPLGDLVICPGVLAREARAQGKSLRAHWAHLFVHGVLHLAGFDHEQADDALRMERREIRVLRALGIANPYRSH
ncbi:MAG: rRNA maturation RNase YbeY [Gammaproteobacteria bacterium]|nr:rRNA maturation RNase YbeY [Gammaproteobacteria bacterium]